MEKAISALCDYFIARQIIQAEDKEVYQYSFEALTMNVLYYLLCFVMMCYYHCFLQPFLFTAVYLLLRSYIGGWHAPNMWACLLFGLLLFITVVNIFIYPGIPEQGKVLFSMFSMIFAGCSVRHFGIQDHPNRKLTKDEKAAAKQNFFRIFFVSSIVMLIAVLLQQIGVVFSIAMAYFMATAFLVLAKLQKKGMSDNEI